MKRFRLSVRSFVRFAVYRGGQCAVGRSACLVPILHDYHERAFALRGKLHWGWVALDLSERLPGTSIVGDSLQKMTLKLNEDTLYSEGVWTRSKESS